MKLLARRGTQPTSRLSGEPCAGRLDDGQTSVVDGVSRLRTPLFDRVLDDLTDDATLADAVESTALAVARHIDDDRDVVHAAYTILGQSASLQQTSIATTAWRDRYVAMIQRHVELDMGDTLTIAGAYLGAIDAGMQHWAGNGGTTSVAEAITVMLERLAPILPPP